MMPQLQTSPVQDGQDLLIKPEEKVDSKTKI